MVAMKEVRRNVKRTEGSYVRLIAFVYHSTLGLIVIKKKMKEVQ